MDYSEMTTLMERFIHKYTQWEDKKKNIWNGFTFV